jgi:hypothetical protein
MSRSVKVRGSVWLSIGSIAGLVLVAAAAISLVPGNDARVEVQKPRADALLAPKADPDAIRLGKNEETAIGANEMRNPDATPEVEAYLLRAYPATDIPTDSSFAARTGWASLNADPHSGGTWQLLGPSQATQPGVLNSLGDFATVVTAGRVTTMAIGPTCSEDRCTIYVAAAGGGVWRTRNGLDDHPDWRFLSASFGTNAMGSLLIDPSDSSGNTIYAGTGEPNASVDSEAGVGIYKSTDGGRSWSLVPGSDIFFQRSIGQLAFDNAGNLLVPIASGVRGVNSTDGGVLSGGSTTHPLVTRGLYRQTGSTFTRIFTAPAPTRGSTTVKVDPTHPGIIYVNAFQQGIWRSADNGTTFSQIFTAQDTSVVNSAIDRSEFDITTLSGGATRMYIGEGQGGGTGHHSNFFRSDNADTAATFTSLGGVQVDNYCDGQCWYDNVVFTPTGNPDVVYLLGSFNYPLFGAGLNNGRAVLLSTDGGSTWSDLTQDGRTPHANATHPDQHAIVVNPNNPFQYWEGSDGGVVRSDGRFVDVSSKCDTRGLTAAGVAYCKSLLWRVPRRLSSMNKGFSTLQFQSLSVSRQNPESNLQGGTQDNGTWQFSGDTVVWTQEIYGDGGQSGFSATDETRRVNTFTAQFNDANFHNGAPTKWVVIGGPIASSPEGSYFYPPVLADPNAANAGTIFQGSFSVWRSQDWGGSQAFLEANCPEFTTSGANPACGDFVVIGPPGQTDLTDSGVYSKTPIYGSDRLGGAVSAIQRSTNRRDKGTLWASTGAGRVFIAANANATANMVVWTRIDNTSTASPGRHPTSIYVDPSNSNHAWISYSGYNVTTPAQPGHVFDVSWNGSAATWTDISNNLPDFPITSIVLDDVTGDLYASSDFGVMRLAQGSSTWTVAGSGLPMVEVPGLQIVPRARLLYAATHGRSAWVLQLPGGGD